MFTMVSHSFVSEIKSTKVRKGKQFIINEEKRLCMEHKPSTNMIFFSLAMRYKVYFHFPLSFTFFNSNVFVINVIFIMFVIAIYSVALTF